MRRILLCMAVMAALAACGGGGKKAAAKSPVNATSDSTATSAAAGAQSAPETGSAAPSSTVPKAGSSATTAKPGAAASGGSAGGSGSGGSSGSGSSGAAGSSGSVGSSPSMTAVPAGHYHYTITGTSSAGSVPPGSDLTVDAPQGTSQHSRVTTQSQNGGGGTTDTTLDKQSDGAHLVDLTTVNNTPFGPVTIAFHPSPPPRIQPQPLAAGATVGPFDMTSTDGKTVATVKVTIQAVNEAVVLGDGTSVATVRVQLDTSLRCASGQPSDCPFTGTITSTRWLRGDGLTVKDHSVTDGTFSGIKISGDTTSLIDKGSPS